MPRHVLQFLGAIRARICSTSMVSLSYSSQHDQRTGADQNRKNDGNNDGQDPWSCLTRIVELLELTLSSKPSAVHYTKPQIEAISQTKSWQTLRTTMACQMLFSARSLKPKLQHALSNFRSSRARSGFSFGGVDASLPLLLLLLLLLPLLRRRRLLQLLLLLLQLPKTRSDYQSIDSHAAGVASPLGRVLQRLEEPEAARACTPNLGWTA